MNECPSCGYSDGHTKNCPVYLGARTLGQDVQLSAKALRAGESQLLLVGGVVLVLVIAVVVLIVVLAGGSDHKTSGRTASAPQAQTSSASPAYMLASLDRGLDPDDDAVSLWQTRLTTLGENCTNPESTLADVVTAAHEDLHHAGFEPSYAEVANTLIGMMRGQPAQDCSSLPVLVVQAARASRG